MKQTIKITLLFGLCVSFNFCTVYKRQYSKGYFINWNKNHYNKNISKETAKNTDTLTRKETSVTKNIGVKSEAKVITSSDNQVSHIVNSNKSENKMLVFKQYNDTLAKEANILHLKLERQYFDRKENTEKAHKTSLIAFWSSVISAGLILLMYVFMIVTEVSLFKWMILFPLGFWITAVIFSLRLIYKLIIKEYEDKRDKLALIVSILLIILSFYMMIALYFLILI